MNNEEIFIGTDNKKIVDFVKNKRFDYCTTHIICAKCGKNNKIHNYEFINNFEAYYVEKGFSVIEFKCYHCKEQYDLSASINVFSPKIIEESFNTAVETLNKLIFNKFENNSINELSKKLINTELKDFENKSYLSYLHVESLFELKNELSQISIETKQFLINCGMTTMKEIFNQILNEIKQ